MVIGYKLLQKTNLEIKAMDQSEKKWVCNATFFPFYNKFISHPVVEFGF